MQSGNQLRVCFPYIGDSIGGSVFSSITLARELDKENGVSVKIFLFNSGVVGEYLHDRGYEYDVPQTSVPSTDMQSLFGRLKFFFIARKRFAQYLDKVEVDLVHSNDMRTAVICGLSVMGRKTRHIWHQRSVFLGGRLAQRLIRRADIIFCNSQYTLSTIPTDVIEKTVQVDNLFLEITPPCPAQGSDQKSSLTIRSKAGNKDIRVGFLGAFNNQKRPILFLDLLRRVHNHYAQSSDGPQVYGLMAGKEAGITRHDLEKRIRHYGLTGYVEVLDFVKEVREFFSEIDVLFATSKREAFGRNILEAMRCGVPVIAHQDGGHVEIIDQGVNGFLLDLDSDKEMAANQIIEIFRMIIREDPEIRRVTANAEMVVDRFCDRQKVVAEVVRHYYLGVAR